MSCAGFINLVLYLVWLVFMMVVEIQEKTEQMTFYSKEGLNTASYSWLRNHRYSWTDV